MPTLDRQDNVFVLDLGDGENRFHPDWLAAGIVDNSVPEDSVRSTAVELAAAQVGKAGDTLGTIKSRMYAPVLAALRAKDNPLG
ncbi:hypothetical protein AB0D24_23020 [Streptomyces javensis]|uniref:hypothetical protein n=1 Tax=Streptomyces javensis TaxID=114698 RepID=UPI0033F3E801